MALSGFWLRSAPGEVRILGAPVHGLGFRVTSNFIQEEQQRLSAKRGLARWKSIYGDLHQMHQRSSIGSLTSSTLIYVSEVLAHGSLLEKTPILAFDVHDRTAGLRFPRRKPQNLLLASFSTSPRIMGPRAHRTLTQQGAVKGMASPYLSVGPILAWACLPAPLKPHGAQA